MNLQDLRGEQGDKLFRPRSKFAWIAKRTSLYHVFVQDAKGRGDVSYVFKLRVW